MLAMTNVPAAPVPKQKSTREFCSTQAIQIEREKPDDYVPSTIGKPRKKAYMCLYKEHGERKLFTLNKLNRI